MKEIESQSLLCSFICSVRTTLKQSAAFPSPRSLQVTTHELRTTIRFSKKDEKHTAITQIIKRNRRIDE